MMVRSVKPLLAAASILALGACSEKLTPTWHQEAGAFLDTGSFGNATMNNTQIQNGEKSYVVELNTRFRQEVPTMVNFAFNSAELEPEARAALLLQADWIRQFPEIRFKVYGHTDLVGSAGYNKRLGQRRANAVVSYLASLGINRSRLDAVVSVGETQPLIYTEEENRTNRRTVTEVTGFVNKSMLLNGKYAEVIFREYVDSATEMPPNADGGLNAIAAAGGG